MSPHADAQARLDVWEAIRGRVRKALILLDSSASTLHGLASGTSHPGMSRCASTRCTSLRIDVRAIRRHDVIFASQHTQVRKPART